ncbi:hypothetical protein C8J56DRAFT_151334 [Mycena floridula]|nr:hypothetical protein C8J56DRAFT_151334 [Mycena floridula]
MECQLLHINEDTTWLLTLPTSKFRLLIDPWLVGPQTDYFAMFSRQHHVTPSLFSSISEIPGGIDGILVAHEFTDHCHEATFRTLSAAQRDLPVWGSPNAKSRITGWKLLSDPVAAIATELTTLQDLGKKAGWSSKKVATVPDDLSIMYVSAPGRWDPAGGRLHGITLLLFSTPAGRRALAYAPHGVAPSAASQVAEALGSVPCIALLHGFDHVTLPLFGQVNFGLDSAVALVKALQPRRWIRTHDEPKLAQGIVGRMLMLDRKEMGDAEKAVQGSKTVTVVLACGESMNLLDV